MSVRSRSLSADDFAPDRTRLSLHPVPASHRERLRAQRLDRARPCRARSGGARVAQGDRRVRQPARDLLVCAVRDLALEPLSRRTPESLREGGGRSIAPASCRRTFTSLRVPSCRGSSCPATPVFSMCSTRSTPSSRRRASPVYAPARSSQAARKNFARSRACWLPIRIRLVWRKQARMGCSRLKRTPDEPRIE